MGRPKLEIDEKLVEGMASVGATNTEIAQFIGCAESTIRGRFKTTLEKARAGLRVKLRRKQIELALDGQPAMLIWLGKQMLDQKERGDVTTDNQPLASRVRVELVRPEGADE